VGLGGVVAALKAASPPEVDHECIVCVHRHTFSSMLTRRKLSVLASALVLPALACQLFTIAATSVSGSAIDVKWTDPPVKTLTLSRSQNPTTGFAAIANFDANTSRYRDRNLASGTTYYYRLEGTTPKGPWRSKVVAATTMSSRADGAAPSVPTGLGLTVSSCTQIRLAWKASSDTGGSGLAGYKVYRNGVFVKLVGAPGTATADGSLAARSTYTYALAAVDNAGNTSAKTAAVSATTPACGGGGAPHANAGPDKSVQSLTATLFDGSGSTDTGGTITAYAWAFGDGTTAAGKQVSHAYRTPGAYVATLTVTDNTGLRASDAANVTVTNRLPVANAGPDRTAGPGSAVGFDGRGSTDADGSVASYAWAFGDGTTASGAVVSHTYAAAGTYTVALTVADNLGARSVDRATVVVSAVAPRGPMWSRTFGGPAWSDNVVPQATATGPNGDVAVVGYFAGTADFGAGAVTSAGGDDIFVAVYRSADGRPVWSKHFGTPNHDFGTAVAVDANGNVLVGGSINGTVSFGGPALTTGASSAFVAKFSAAGAHLWSKLIGGATNSSVTGAAVDGNGNVFAVGTFSGSANFGTGTLTSAGQWDGYIAAYAAVDGRALWTRRAGGSGVDTPRAVAVDSLGHVVATGVFQNSADFGGGPLRSAGQYDVFLAQYGSADGRYLWSKRFGSSGNDYGVGIGVDGSGNVVIAGDYHGTIDFGGGALVDGGAGSAVFAAKFSSAGGLLWSKSFGTGFVDAAMKGAAVDRSGNVMFTCVSVDGMDFGGGMLPMSGGSDPFFVELSAAGAHRWSLRFPSSTQSYNASAAVAADAAGNAVLSGNFTGTIDLGGTRQTDADGRVRDSFDGFLVKLHP